MKMPALRPALLIASLAAGRGLAAQDIPTFHAGQWAAEFTGGDGASEGVMRFFSPRSALVISGSASLSHNTAAPDNATESTSSLRSLFLALGVRRHTTIASRVLATTELGANIGLSRGKTTTDAFGDPVTGRQSQTNYGIFGEIGGQYFVASHLALGTVATLSASRTSARAESGGTGTDYRGFSLSTVLRPIRITLYF